MDSFRPKRILPGASYRSSDPRLCFLVRFQNYLQTKVDRSAGLINASYARPQSEATSKTTSTAYPRKPMSILTSTDKTDSPGLRFFSELDDITKCPLEYPRVCSATLTVTPPPCEMSTVQTLQLVTGLPSTFRISGCLRVPFIVSIPFTNF